MTNAQQLWDECLKNIEGCVSGPNFTTWFRDTFIDKVDGGTIYVAVPNEFTREWLSTHHAKLIMKTLCDLYADTRGVEFVISKGGDRAKKKEVVLKKGAPINQLPLEEHYINKESNLNPRYAFDSFIVGPFNELAYAASQAILTKPGIAYNPFFIYGPTGLGKTHLIQAIGNSLEESLKGKRIFYTTLEKFSNDFVLSIHNNRSNKFKEKYRQYDVLIMDDIQFIAGKDKTQDELFHLFNSLYEENKQMIFSSDKHPNYIQGLEDRLKSRFASSMIVDIEPPEFESRLAILNAKCSSQEIAIEKEVLEEISRLVEGNIRELEGSLNNIIAQINLKGRPVSKNEVRNLLKNNMRPKKNVVVKDVVNIISGFYDIEDSLIYEKTRRKEVVKARQVIMYILREDFNISYPLIGQKLGGKDHTTVIHSCLKIKNDLREDPSLSQELEQVRAMIK